LTAARRMRYCMRQMTRSNAIFGFWFGWYFYPPRFLRVLSEPTTVGNDSSLRRGPGLFLLARASSIPVGANLVFALVASPEYAGRTQGSPLRHAINGGPQ